MMWKGHFRVCVLCGSFTVVERVECLIQAANEQAACSLTSLTCTGP